MRIRGLGRLRRGARALLHRLQPRGVILLYHRIADPPIDPQQLCVTPGHFAEHLDVLGRTGRVLPLRELVRSLSTRTVRRGSVVITFDDGYADNCSEALPLLERYSAPATVFVTAGHVGSERPFWWDELEQILLRTPSLPSSIELRIDGEHCCFALDRSEVPWTAGERTDRRWSIATPDDLSPRHHAYRRLFWLLRPLAAAAREEALAALRSQIRNGETPIRDARALTAKELARLGDHPLIEVGAHTMTHPALAHLPPESQWQEIQGSKGALEGALGRPVTSFSYPFGGDPEVGEVAPRLAASAGFEAACTTRPEAVMLGASPYRLPRFVVQDCDGEEFARGIRAFFTG